MSFHNQVRKRWVVPCSKSNIFLDIVKQGPLVQIQWKIFLDRFKYTNQYPED